MHMSIEGRKLVRTLDIHRHLTQEIKIVFKNDGVHITSVDPAYQRMVVTVLKKTACKEFDIKEHGVLVIGVDLVKIWDFLKIGTPQDVFTFDYDDENHRLVVRLGNLVRTMGLLDIEGMPDLKPPDLVWANKTILSSKVLHASVKAIMPDNKKNKAMLKGLLTVTGENLFFTSYTDVENENTVKSTMLTTDRDLIYHRCGIPVKIVFNLTDIEEQAQDLKRSFDEVIVETNGDGDPIKTSASNNDMTVEYYHAVIIENNEGTPETEKKEPLSDHLTVSAVAEPETKVQEIPDPMDPIETLVAKPEVPLEEQIVAEKPRIDIEKPVSGTPVSTRRPRKNGVTRLNEPAVAVRKEKNRESEAIGCFASLRTKTKLAGVITEVTKTGYLILFRGMTSKTLEKPVEIERNLVEVYRKVKKR